jgi:hypothetical protein
MVSGLPESPFSKLIKIGNVTGNDCVKNNTDGVVFSWFLGENNRYLFFETAS